MNVDGLQARLRTFSEERDWLEFHTPKNLAMALSVEASELLEIFQWLTAEQSTEVMMGVRGDDVRDEVSDVAIYLLRLADVLGLDLEAEVSAKITRNTARFQPGSAMVWPDFVGDVRFADLTTAEAPRQPGIYIVRRQRALGPPVFLEQSNAGHFKGKDPTQSVEHLAARWVDDAEIVYIGKAGGGGSTATLFSRLRQFASFGDGRPVGHWGGRSIFQIAGWEDLRVSWAVVEDARPLERRLIQDFVEEHGRRPFANLTG